MFCRHLYLDKDTSKEFNSLRRKFRDKKYPSGIYVIALSKHCSRVEYYDSKMLKYKFYEETGYDPFIIGLAKGAESAMNMVEGIINEVYKAKGNVDVTAYLKEKVEMLSLKKDAKYKITVINQESEK